MIALSRNQIQLYALPLIYKTMTEDVAARAVYEFNEDCEYDVWGLFDGDVLIGCVGIGSEISTKKVWLGYFAVDPHYQNLGYGDRIINFVENEVRERGYRWLQVETYDSPKYEKALKFYSKHGYKEIGRLADYLDDDSDAIYLRKKLY